MLRRSLNMNQVNGAMGVSKAFERPAFRRDQLQHDTKNSRALFLYNLMTHSLKQIKTVLLGSSLGSLNLTT